MSATKSYDETTVAGKATAKFVRVSPRKVRAMIDQIRYKTVAEAEAILKFTPKPAVVPAVTKVLNAAKASVNRHDFPNVEELVIGDVRADGGPMFKRVKPQSRGRASLIRRRSCHITMRLMPPA
jgi:large subunit ribosomal protein L22